MNSSLDIVVLGLSVTSSWGNGHATTYRSLIGGLGARGHRILFLERDAYWYAENRDEPHPPGALTRIYSTFEELLANYEDSVREADLVLVGSYVPEGIRIGRWVTSVARGLTAFYDIDTPVTLGTIASGECEYIDTDLIRRYNGYLSFTGGPALKLIERRYGSPMARPLYCSVDPSDYRPMHVREQWDLGYLGTYSDDRQPIVEALLIEPARRWPQGRFNVTGPKYPKSIVWPRNVDREIHLSPREHPEFYGAQRFSLNVTREAMKAAGFSPSVRLFEAGACAVPVISDLWPGLDEFFAIGKEVLVSEGAEDTLRYLRDTPDTVRRAIGWAARERVLAGHTPAARALQFEGYWKEMNDNFSSHSARRNRRSGEDARGVPAGLASQHPWEGAGGTAGAETCAVPNDSGI